MAEPNELGLNLENEEEVQQFKKLLPFHITKSKEDLSLLKHALKHKDLYFPVVALLGQKSITDSYAPDMADLQILQAVLSEFPSDPPPDPSSLKILGDFLDQQTHCRVTPVITQFTHDTLKDAVLQKNLIPSEPAERCFTYLATNYTNHPIYISSGSVEFFVVQLTNKFTLPIGQNYLSALHNMAFHHKSAQERCGKDGVFVALRMLRNHSALAAEFLAALMNLQTNRTFVRTSNGVEMVLGYTKRTRATTGLVILCQLSEEDPSICTKVVRELPDQLVEIVNTPDSSRERSFVYGWLTVVDDQDALGKIAEKGMIEAIYKQEGIKENALALIDKLAAAYDYFENITVHEVIDNLGSFQLQLLHLLTEGDSTPQEEEHALSIFASYFRSVELEDKANYHGDRRSVLHTLFPVLLEFIKQQRCVMNAVIVMVGLKLNAKVKYPLPDVMPYVGIIVRAASEAIQDIPSATSTVALLYLLSQTYSNIPALLEDDVITFLQLFRTNDSHSPYVDELHKRLSPNGPENTNASKPDPVLLNFMSKESAPTSRYLQALSKGAAALSILEFAKQGTGFPAIGTLCKLAFHSAATIAAQGIPFLVHLAGKSQGRYDMDILVTLWMSTLTKHSRSYLTEGTRSTLMTFITEFSPNGKEQHHLKNAILFNLETSDTGNTDDSGSYDLDSLGPAPAEQKPSEQPSKTKKKKKKKAPQPEPPAKNPEPKKDTKFREAVGSMVFSFRNMCQMALRELPNQQSTTKDTFENILLFFRFLPSDVLTSFSFNFCYVLILNIWLYGTEKQISTSLELLSDLRSKLPNVGQSETELLNEIMPAVKKYIQAGREVAPLLPASATAIVRMLNEWSAQNKLNFFPTNTPPDSADPKLQEELKKLKETISHQKKTITSLQQTNTQQTDIQKQKDQEIDKLKAQLEKQDTDKKQTNLKTILASLDLETIDNLEEFQEFYVQLKLKVKSAKQRKAKLKQEKEEKNKQAFLCPICLANRVSIICNPCGHFFCKNCSETMFNANGKKCPICRSAVSNTITAYL
eukprot:Phypoly_transcript_01647.p1 GENE.Phypoly_transcript_01647~~Phypoly_transcript_01647.p1  ORF type:complete len:1036 (+),score=181.29 Phypoly_transcript_01647:107-3214(+)